MKGLPYIVFSFLMLCALCSGMNSYRNTENRIAQDVNQALEQVLVKMPNQVITTDTIRCYRSYLTIAELKDTAGIALRTVRRNGRLETRLVAEIGAWFSETGRDTLYPCAQIDFVTGEAAGEHFHLPFVIAPGGWSTYRGS